MSAPTAPGAAIGILGGGQLGRMLAHAAEQLGFDVHIYTDEEDSPAARVAARAVVADYHDHAALAAFARDVAVVTTEFENVPADAAAALIAAGAVVHPNPRALAIAQDRLEEKRFFAANGLTPAPFAPVETLDELRAALALIGCPAILKTRRLGYDGRGQARLESDRALEYAFAAFNGAPLIRSRSLDHRRTRRGRRFRRLRSLRERAPRRRARAHQRPGALRSGDPCGGRRRGAPADGRARLCRRADDRVLPDAGRDAHRQRNGAARAQ
jgi:hypothetical protein